MNTIKATQDNFDFDRLATAIRKLSISASGSLCRDCFTHAALGAHVLKQNGIDAQIAVGVAAWRVGNGDGDVITHIPSPSMQESFTDGQFPYHAWISINNKILDLTTYQLPHKARQLDEMDGGKTTVEWGPEYLLVDSSTINSYAEVAQLHAGMYFYKRVPEIEQKMLSNFDLDQEDINFLLYLFHNPDTIVFGPNDAMKLAA